MRVKHRNRITMPPSRADILSFRRRRRPGALVPKTPKTDMTKRNPASPTIQPLKDGTARLIFKWPPEPGPPRRPLAVRYAINSEDEIEIRSGALLGFDSGHSSVVILIVKPGDLISVGGKPIGGATATWTHHRVGRGFRLRQIAITGRCLTNAEIRSLARGAVPLEQPPGCDDTLREFLTDPDHPGWLVPILERQKQKWRSHRPSKFYHLAPAPALPGELERIVKLAPGAALRFHFDRLTKGQVKRCIRRDLATAIVHFYRHMSPAHLRKACRDYPSLLLEHRGSELSEDNLLFCVRFEPFKSFAIRKRFPSPVHALILAATCDLPFELFDCGDISGLPAEIEASFRQFPETWVKSYGSDYSTLFRTLERRGKMTVNHDLIGFLMERLPHQHLPKLRQFIANRL